MGRSADPERERFWREVVEDQRSSGLSIRAYCEQIGVSQPSFYAWRRRLEGRWGPSFLPVEVAEAEPQVRQESKLEIVLAGDRTIRVSGGTDLELLAEVVRVLEAIDGRGRSA